MTIKYGQGLGWGVNARDNLILHLGNTWGFASSLVVATEKETAITLLANVYVYKEHIPLATEVLLANWDG